METYINEEKPLVIEGKVGEISPEMPQNQELMGKKVLIATLYNPDPVILASTRLGPDRIFLLVNKEPTKEQEASVKLIQDSLGKVIDVKVVKIDVYNIVEVAKRAVELIDAQPTEDHIFINITAGRKTQAIGLLFAAYARHEKVSKIAYNPEEDKSSIVYLPRLSFKLTDTQKAILEELEKKKYASIADLADKVKQSTAMLYRNLTELRDMDLIDDNELSLTDAGKIARL